MNRFICVVGANRTGKSTEARSEIKNYIAEKSKMKRKHSVITLDTQSVFTDLSDFFITPNLELINQNGRGLGSIPEIWEEIKNSFIVFDDYKVALPSTRVPAWLEKMLYMKDKNNIDFMFITHSPDLVINGISHYVKEWYIFRTMNAKLSKDVGEKVRIETSIKIINSFCREYGVGTKIDNRKIYPNFPHIRIGYNTESLKFFNYQNFCDKSEFRNFMKKM